MLRQPCQPDRQLLYIPVSAGQPETSIQAYHPQRIGIKDKPRTPP